MRKFIFATLFAVACSLLVHADTVSFVPASSGSLGVSSKTYGSITATAYYWNGSSWVTGVSGLSLYGRAETNDNGIGVCDPLEFGNGTTTNTCGTSGGKGDWNELSNEMAPELIRLSKTAGTAWVSVQLSSLDGNGSTNPANYEHGTLWASNGSFGSAVAVCNFIALGGSSTCFGSTTNLEPTINIGAQYANYSYLYIQANDWSTACVQNHVCNTNNDFLVRAATVPEPGSMALLAGGFLGLLALIRRRR